MGTGTIRIRWNHDFGDRERKETASGRSWAMRRLADNSGIEVS